MASFYYAWYSVEVPLDVLKVGILTTASFLIALAFTPFLTHFLYSYKLWRKEVRTKALDGSGTPIFAKLHGEHETRVPRMGGVLIWGSTTILAMATVVLAKTIDGSLFDKLNFVSRSQTWLPLFTLVSASLVGLVDDVLQVFGKGGYVAGGLKLRHRIGVVALLGLIGAWWFYSRLSVSSVHVPFFGSIELGVLFIPFFVLVMLAVFSGGVVDGLDGLAGGVFATIFSAYGIIALLPNQTDIAAFCGVIAGALLAFLWFNIPPARFFAGETGILGLTCALTVVTFLTNAVLVLPIIGIILAVESGSVIVQLMSKRFRGRKIFLSTPIHHHFEALGWPAHKVTMRFWVVSAVAALLGVVVQLLG